MSEHPPLADRPTGPGGSGHPEIDELAAYAAGDIDVAGGESISAHVQQCADCSADIEALERVTAMLAQLGSVAMPADVAARLDARLAQEATEPAGLTKDSSPVSGNVLPMRRRTPSWASGAAAAAVIGVLAFLGIAVVNGGGARDDKDSATSATLAAASAGRRYASGTNYTNDAIRQQVAAVLQTPGDAAREDSAAKAAGDRAASTAAATFSAAATSAAPAASAAASSAAAPAPAAAAAPESSAAASASSSAAAAEAAPTAADASSAPLLSAESASAAASGAAGTTSDASALAPPADLSALQNDPARLARCINSVTDGLSEPVALDFATYEGRPALAIVLPANSAGSNEVYIVGGECGAGDDANVLHYATLPAG